MGQKFSLCHTMIDPASSWFEIIELPVTTNAVIPMESKGQRGTQTHNNTKLPYYDKSSAMINNLVNKTWFSNYQHCQFIIYDNGSELKLCLKAFRSSYEIRHKAISVKNPQANAIL